MATTRKSTSRKSSVNKSNIPNEYFTKFNMHKNLVKHSKTKPNRYIALIADNPELHNLELNQDSYTLHENLGDTINIRDKKNNLHTVDKTDISRGTLIWYFACNKKDVTTGYDYDECPEGESTYLRDFIIVEYKKKFSLGSSQKVITRKNKKRWFR